MREVLLVAARIKQHGRRKLCSLPACLHFCWQGHLSCCCTIRSLLWGLVSLHFQHTLKTSSSPGKLQAFSTRLGLLRQPALWTEQLLDLSLSYSIWALLDCSDGICFYCIFILSFCPSREPWLMKTTNVVYNLERRARESYWKRRRNRAQAKEHVSHRRGCVMAHLHGQPDGPGKRHLRRETASLDCPVARCGAFS